MHQQKKVKDAIHERCIVCSLAFSLDFEGHFKSHKLLCHIKVTDLSGDTSELTTSYN